MDLNASLASSFAGIYGDDYSNAEFLQAMAAEAEAKVQAKLQQRLGCDSGASLSSSSASSKTKPSSVDNDGQQKQQEEKQKPQQASESQSCNQTTNIPINATNTNTNTNNRRKTSRRTKRTSSQPALSSSLSMSLTQLKETRQAIGMKWSPSFSADVEGKTDGEIIDASEEVADRDVNVDDDDDDDDDGDAGITVDKALEEKVESKRRARMSKKKEKVEEVTIPFQDPGLRDEEAGEQVGYTEHQHWSEEIEHVQDSDAVIETIPGGIMLMVKDELCSKDSLAHDYTGNDSFNDSVGGLSKRSGGNNFLNDSGGTSKQSDGNSSLNDSGVLSKQSGDKQKRQNENRTSRQHSRSERQRRKENGTSKDKREIVKDDSRTSPLSVGVNGIKIEDTYYDQEVDLAPPTQSTRKKQSKKKGNSSRSMRQGQLSSPPGKDAGDSSSTPRIQSKSMVSTKIHDTPENNSLTPGCSNDQGHDLDKQVVDQQTASSGQSLRKKLSKKESKPSRRPRQPPPQYSRSSSMVTFGDDMPMNANSSASSLDDGSNSDGDGINIEGIEDDEAGLAPPAAHSPTKKQGRKEGNSSRSMRRSSEGDSNMRVGQPPPQYSRSSSMVTFDDGMPMNSNSSASSQDDNSNNDGDNINVEDIEGEEAGLAPPGAESSKKKRGKKEGTSSRSMRRSSRSSLRDSNNGDSINIEDMEGEEAGLTPPVAESSRKKRGKKEGTSSQSMRRSSRSSLGDSNNGDSINIEDVENDLAPQEKSSRKKQGMKEGTSSRSMRRSSLDDSIGIEDLENEEAELARPPAQSSRKKQGRREGTSSRPMRHSTSRLSKEEGLSSSAPKMQYATKNSSKIHRGAQGEAIKGDMNTSGDIHRNNITESNLGDSNSNCDSAKNKKKESSSRSRRRRPGKEEGLTASMPHMKYEDSKDSLPKRLASVGSHRSSAITFGDHNTSMGSILEDSNKSLFLMGEHGDRGEEKDLAASKIFSMMYE